MSNTNPDGEMYSNEETSTSPVLSGGKLRKIHRLRKKPRLDEHKSRVEGFQTANGTKIPISEEAFRRHSTLFDDILNETNYKRENKLNFLQKTDSARRDQNSKSNDDFCGFPTTDLTVSTSKLDQFDAILSPQQEQINTNNNYQELLENLDEEFFMCNFIADSNNNNGKFSTANGKTIQIAQEKIDNARRKFYDSILEEDLLNVDEEKRKIRQEKPPQCIFTPKFNTFKKISFSENVSVEFSDDYSTPGNSNNKENFPGNQDTPVIRKKRLGTRTVKQKEIPISPENLRKAREILEETLKFSPLKTEPKLNVNYAIVNRVKMSGPQLLQSLREKRDKLEMEIRKIQGKEIALEQLLSGNMKTVENHLETSQKQVVLKDLKWYNCPVENPLKITPLTAEQFHFKSPIGGVIHLANGTKLIANTHDLIGPDEINTNFLYSGKVAPSGWVENHYKWIVWKLASYEDHFPSLKHCLTLENVLAQLNQRYKREILDGKHSALKRLLEDGDSAQKRLILCVSDVRTLDGGAIDMRLTDGWYEIRTIIDDPIRLQIRCNRIQIGTKLCICGAELILSGGVDNVALLWSGVRLKINANCTRRAIWWSKLGFQSVPAAFPLRLNTIIPNGGVVGAIKFYIARVYPLNYMERRTDGNTVWRNGGAHQFAHAQSVQRDVTTVQTLLITCSYSNNDYGVKFNVWQPKFTDFHENTVLFAYNILPKSNGDLNTTAKTIFKSVPNEDLKRFRKFKRTLLPIAMLIDFRTNVAIFDEFDTIGLVVSYTVTEDEQILWLSDFLGRMCRIKIAEGPKTCCLFTNLSVNRIIVGYNLKIHPPKGSSYGQAIGTRHTKIVSTPLNDLDLQQEVDTFTGQLPVDRPKFVLNCQNKCQEFEGNSDDDEMDDSTLVYSRITSSDMAMSLIDIDNLI